MSVVPRIAPSVIARPRLENWFSRFNKVPVRCLVAPAGCGKTTAILSYLRTNQVGAFYHAIKDGETAADLRAALAAMLSLSKAPETVEDLARSLAERAPLELALDRVDAAEADARTEIRRLIELLPESVSLLIALRSRAAFDVGELIARGMATLCDFERLAFDAAEVRHLAETCDVSFSHGDVVKLLEASDGWPIVVSSAIRKAAEDGRNLAEAFENWRKLHGHLFAEYIAAAIENAPHREASYVRELASGGSRDEADMKAMESNGLFVIHSSDGYRLLRAITRMRSYQRSESLKGRIVPMQVQLFGCFEATIDGRRIEWIRRRDQQIFKYVALKRAGVVTRAELAGTFWPGAEKHLATQSVRTACSNIRKAIGNVVGFDAVDQYFRANGDVAISLENVIIDVNRFSQHLDDGDRQFERRELRVAQSRYRTADRLYTNRLLAGDPQESWFEAQAELLETRYTIVIERLAEIANEFGDVSAARTLAKRALALRPGNGAMLALVSQVDRTSFRDLAVSAGPDGAQRLKFEARASA